MTAMKISAKGAMELVGHEAIVQTRYKDSGGTWTIGVGHTRSAGAPNPATYTDTMSVDDVIALFRTDVVKYADLVNAALTGNIGQAQFDALVSYCYNTGRSKTKMADALNQGDKAGAIEAFNALVPATRPDVRDRRADEAKLFETGVYTRGRKAVIYPVGANNRPVWGKGKSIDLTPYFP